MKSLALLCFVLLTASAASATPRATVVIHASATVSGDYFELGDIATVSSPDTAFRLQLLSAVMGRAPLSGLTRPFNEGDVSLKLRQSGIDPETISITGATDIVVIGSNGATPVVAINPPAATTTASTVNPSTTAVAAPKQILIHPGDAVTLVYDSEGMVISASVVATSSGGVGDTIQLRRDGAIHPLEGIVQDAQTVKMVE